MGTKAHRMVSLKGAHFTSLTALFVTLLFLKSVTKSAVRKVKCAMCPLSQPYSFSLFFNSLANRYSPRFAGFSGS